MGSKKTLRKINSTVQGGGHNTEAHPKSDKEKKQIKKQIKGHVFFIIIIILPFFLV